MTATIADPSLDAQFIAFDSANPRVFIEFRRLAEEMFNAQIAKGKSPKIGAGAIYEPRRWEIAIDTTNTYGPDYKLNNNLRSRYARKLAAEDRRFLSAFEFRRLKSRDLKLEAY